MDFSKSPEENFAAEIKNAEEKVSKDFNAMSLATVGPQGQPSVRIVFYKGLIRGGLSFYTNYNSQKSSELENSKRAALLFFWKELDQQIRVEGIVEKLTPSESEAYFRTRPRLSQIGAWASEQSAVIESHQVLENRVKEFETKFQGKEVPRPPHWGGFHVIPLKFEFWFGKTGRLHERFVYERASQTSAWTKSIRSP